MAVAKKKSGRAAKGGASPSSGWVWSSEQEVLLVLEQLPGAEFRKKFHGVSFFVGEKVFAFLAKDGVVLKLTAARVQELVREREARALVMGQRVMREWVVVGCPRGLGGEVELLREAMGFAGPREGRGGVRRRRDGG